MEARISFPMVITFPRSSLSYRTDYLTQFNSKAGVCGRNLPPDVNQVEPDPGMRRPTTVCLPPSCAASSLRSSRSVSGHELGDLTAIVGDEPSAPEALATVRVVLSRSVTAESASSA